MKTPETLRVLEKYVPKKLHGAIKEITKDGYGYEVVLEPLWLFERRSEEGRVGKECRSRWSPYH